MVRLIRQPFGTVNGIALHRYRLGQVYDLPPSVAEYLVLEGYAIIEMRRGQRSKRARRTDRRKYVTT
jgi:hypothetical protein